MYAADDGICGVGRKLDSTAPRVFVLRSGFGEFVTDSDVGAVVIGLPLTSTTLRLTRDVP